MMPGNAPEEPHHRPLPRNRQLLLGIVLAIAYGIGCRLDPHATDTLGFASFVGIPAGIALVGLALGGRGLWPAVAIGGLAANLSLRLPLAASGELALAGTLEAVIGNELFRAFRRSEPGLERVRDVLGLTLAAFVSTLIGATIGTSVLLQAGRIPPGTSGSIELQWWLVDAIGILIIAPLGLAWRDIRPRFELSRIPEGLVLLSVLVVAVQVLTGQWWPAEVSHNVRLYVVFPVAVWAAMRFGIQGVAVANLTLIAFMSWRVISDDPFQSVTVGERFFHFQGFLAAVSLTDLLLAAALAERDHAVTALGRALGGLEQRVRDRTLELQRLNEALVREFDDRREAEALRAESDLLLKESQRMSGVGSWAWDPATGRWTLSEELLRIFRWPERNRTTDTATFLGHVHPDDRASLRDVLAGARDTRTAFDHSYRIVRADGTQRLLEIRGEEQRVAGRPRRLIGAVQDVTERRYAEEALRRSEERFRFLVDGVRDYAIVTLDPAGRVASWNSGAKRITGYEAGEILGEHVSRFCLPEDRDAESGEHLAAAVQAPIEYEGWRLRKDASRFWGNVVLSSVHDQHGQLVGFAQVMRDLTDRRRADEELRRAHALLEARVAERTTELRRTNAELVREIAERAAIERALEHQTKELGRSNADLERFASVASHDLQEPLRSVSQFTALLAKRYRGRFGAEADEYLAFINEGTAWMEALIKDLLAYARAGSAQLEVEPVSCDEALDRALKNLQHAVERSGATVTHEPLPRIRADAKQITQLFQNLISNALKFHRDSPLVHVHAERAGSEWIFSVEDNGIGMERRHLERIFIVFQRLHSKKQYRGTGIGLAICKRIAERHGGRIWAESTPGRGSKFSFALPAGEPALQADPELAARDVGVGEGV